MIPVRLEIEGLYSYREKQTVEFEKLTGAGIFGIFGAVGSGKSSILEAILLALYGSTERLAATGERSSMLNLQSDQILINFIFKAGKNNSQTFLARYFAKRNRKDPEKIETGEHTFYQQNGGNWEALDQKADELIGMSKEHFKQTVIIPQGKFREFIDQSPKERADMMQQLFGLDRFDLSAKTGMLRKEAELEKTRLKALLDNLEGVSQEVFMQQEQSLELNRKDVEEASKLLEKLDSKWRKAEGIRKSFLQLKEYQNTKLELEKRLPEIESKRELYRDFITAKTQIRPIWDRLVDTKKDLEKYQVSAIDTERFAGIIAKEILQLESEEELLREKNEERPLREARIRDLKRVLEIKEINEKLEKLNQTSETLQPEIDAKKDSLALLEKEIANLEIQVESLPETDPNLLSELLSAKTGWNSAEQRIQELQAIQKNFKTEEVEVSKILENISFSIPKNETSLESWLGSQRKAIESLESEREKILRTQGLQAHAHLLVDGEPCPLCGSDHHPNPLNSEGKDLFIRKKELEIHQEKEQLEKILTLIQKRKIEEANLDNHKKNIQEKSREIQKNQDHLQELLARLSSLGLENLDGLNEKIQSLQKLGTEADLLNKSLQGKRKVWNTQRQEVEVSQKELQNLQASQQSLHTLLNSKTSELKEPEFCRQFFQMKPETIQHAIAKVEKDIEEAANLFKGKQKHLQDKRAEQVKNQADLENFKNLSKESAKKVQELEHQFESLKIQHGFTDEEALIKLLHQNLDAEKVDLEIRQFDQKMNTTSTRILELSEEEGVKEFSEESFSELQNKVDFQKIHVQELQSQLAISQENLKSLAEKLEKKAVLQKDFYEIENREIGLRELERLFQGKGFVKYVSSIYLRELCNTANVRFMKLTKNSLSLEIDGDNTFWVVDYLNGGKKRLLKTLSGGQTFQASLCLALALAEKVKALNQADQSFFFLDEGFGALDRDSLRVVFETLKSLRHENRIVGIISHVEELQQEIGVFAKVELDPEIGSKIQYSY